MAGRIAVPKPPTGTEPVGDVQKPQEPQGGSGYSKTQRAPYEARYRALWAQDWPPGKAGGPDYIDRIIDSGLNVDEMEAHERAKPAFQHFSALGKEEMANHDQMLREANGAS